MNVTQAVKARMSCRAFSERTVSRGLVEDLLKRAGQAPSGGNLQPWHVYVLSGDKLAALVADVAKAMKQTPRGEETEYRVYPKDLKEPYFTRRFKCGEDLYASIGVAREDREGRLNQFYRNFALFGAPVGLFFYIDRQMQPGQWSDLGMYMQTLMLLAVEQGLHSCAQEAWAAWHTTVTRHVGAPRHLMLFSGMALGYRDEEAPINSLRTERADLSEFATLAGF